MHAFFLLLGSLGALSGVMLGAFGAHGLKHSLSTDAMAIYQTGVQYQMWHALGLILIAALYKTTANAHYLKWAGWLMLGGILLFSGSLYLLAVSGIKNLGMVTPFGGLAFLGAWACIAYYAYQETRSHSIS